MSRTRTGDRSTPRFVASAAPVGDPGHEQLLSLPALAPRVLRIDTLPVDLAIEASFEVKPGSLEMEVGRASHSFTCSPNGSAGRPLLGGYITTVLG